MGVAQLYNDGRYTKFRYGDTVLTFIAPYSLERYLEVIKWDSGYIEVMTKYTHSKQAIEEYIDLSPILKDLFIDENSFLSPIEKVEVKQ